MAHIWFTASFPALVSVTLASPYPLFLHHFHWFAGDASHVGWSAGIADPLLSNMVQVPLHNTVPALKSFIFYRRLLHLCLCTVEK